MDDLPQPVAELVDLLASMPGAVAVALGGSRALGCSNAGSDWDLGLYYRGAIDLTALGARGTVQIETLTAIPIEMFIRTIGKKTK